MPKKRSSVTETLLSQDSARAVPKVIIDVSSIAEFHGGEKMSELRVTIPGLHGAPEIYDLTFLCHFSRLSEPAIEGFKRHVLDLKGVTRQKFVKYLRNGLFGFLRQEGILQIELAQVGREVWSAFVKWLDKPRVDGEPWTPLFRRLHLYAAILLFEALASIPRWSEQASQVVATAPRGAYPGAEKKIIPRRRLDNAHLIAIKKAAETEVQAIVERFAEADRLLVNGSIELSGRVPDYRNNFSVCFASIVALYPDLIPPKAEMRLQLLDRGGNSSRLYYAAQDHNFQRFHAYRYALSDDLIPFALLLSIITALNPEQVLTLKLNEVDLGRGDRNSNLRIDVFKARAGKIQTVSLAGGDLDELGPRYLFHHLDRITRRIRPFAGQYRDNWLIFRQTVGTWNTVGFGGVKRTATTGTFSKALARFCDKHNLARFGISQIRPTLGDEVRIRAGVYAAKELLQHVSIDTTDRSYTSDGTRERGLQFIGEIQALQDRWVQSNGNIDPRKNSRGNLDKGAATPGFGCHDPFNPPLEQSKGRGGLCRAYGECPTCPLVVAYDHDPMAAALYVGLLDAIFRSVRHIDPLSWQRKWQPIARAVECLISSIPAFVLDQRPTLPYPLPPVG